MSEEQNILLPDDDPDLILSQQLGEVLNSGDSFTSLKNRLIDVLVEFKDKEQKTYQNYELDSTKLWKNIDLQTRKAAKITPLFQRRIAYTWAAAAVVLIAAFVGFFWITTSTPDTALLAQSDSTITTISLEDGTEVTLRPYSQLFELAVNDDERTYSIIGEGYFDVTSDENRPFSVTAGQGVVTVLGTRFNLSSWGNSSKVYLEEGRISFNTIDGKEPLILEPGQSSMITDGIISYTDEALAEEFTDWISNTIVFNSSIPEEVVAEVGQHFNITIDVSPLDDISTVTGSLRLDSVSQTLEDLGLVLGGTFRQAADDKYVFVAIN
ncbi:MAG: hypothetical protein ED557_02435 [Balneola sp.]|nr:MAG: hypothetical protein ED557_02435 [Balneola sp.]